MYIVISAYIIECKDVIFLRICIRCQEHLQMYDTLFLQKCTVTVLHRTRKRPLSYNILKSNYSCVYYFVQGRHLGKMSFLGMFFSNEQTMSEYFFFKLI